MPQRPRKPLPPALTATPFTVAQGLSLGVGERRLGGGDLERPFHGIRSVPAALCGADAGGRPTAWWEVDLELSRRCRALMVAMPDGAFFTHVTAARLWPLPLPRPPFAEAMHVGIRAPVYPPRRAAVVGHRLEDSRLKVVDRRGLPVVDPATLFCELAVQLSLPDLVAVGDALVLQPVFDEPWEERPWVPLRQLSERVDSFRGRGKLAARRALALIRPGAESRPESLLRLAMMESGLPEPEVNLDIDDARGRFIGRGDLVYRRWRVIVEYDGDQHRHDTRQFDRDVQRLERFARNGWRVIRIVGRSFFGDRPGCMERVRDALLDAGWRP